MAFEIRVPRLGWNMESGVFAGWLKKDGDRVEEGTPIFSIESDKALQEVEAFASGILRISPGCPAPGTTVEVGALLGYIAQPDEALEFEGAAASVSAAPPPVPVPTPPAAAPASPAEAPAASPRARRVARELGVDLSQVQGSGREGRIVERDVREAARLVGAKPQAPPTEAGTPLSSVRSTIAARMHAGVTEAAPVTLIAEADATELFLLKSRLESDAGRDSRGPTFTDLFVLICAKALTAHPELNARFEGGKVFREESVHLALAVDTPDGLLAPVIRDAQAKDLATICRETATLIERARARKLLPEELQGGTFTLSNLGMYRVDAFTPILNLPQCAILGVGRISWKPAVHGGKVVPRQRVTFSLTFDHRVVDGAPAARFLSTLCEYVEKPDTWFQAL